MDFEVIHIDETDSTNRWLRNNPSLFRNNPSLFDNKGGLLEEDAQKTCMVVVAAYQTAGKGCGSNSWESERGKNLTFSMLIQPEDIPANEQFRITEITSVAMCETLKRYGCKEVSIKWPNDIYVGDRKICGMLIENRLQGSTIKESIIGIGLNVNQTEFRSNAPNPVSLKQLTGNETDIEELLSAFLSRFESVSLSETTSFDYRNRLFRQGKQSVYRDKTGVFEAELLDVRSDGCLLLRDAEGKERTYAFKEVEFVI